eukprot:2079021-Pleurochrysis_carterae.AAC.3
MRRLSWKIIYLITLCVSIGQGISTLRGRVRFACWAEQSGWASLLCCASDAMATALGLRGGPEAPPSTGTRLLYRSTDALPRCRRRYILGRPRRALCSCMHKPQACPWWMLVARTSYLKLVHINTVVCRLHEMPMLCFHA